MIRSRLVVLSFGLVATAVAGSAKPRTYTNVQHNGIAHMHVTKATFAPLPAWKEAAPDKHNALPTFPVFEDGPDNVVLQIVDFSVTGKTPAERLDAGVRSMFLDSADATKIERTDRKNGRWWVVDRNSKMRKLHAVLFVPETNGYFAMCDLRTDDPKQLDVLAPVCDTLTVTSSQDRAPTKAELPE